MYHFSFIFVVSSTNYKTPPPTNTSVHNKRAQETSIERSMLLSSEEILSIEINIRITFKIIFIFSCHFLRYFKTILASYTFTVSFYLLQIQILLMAYYVQLIIFKRIQLMFDQLNDS
jgi:hypothetical protein